VQAPKSSHAAKRFQAQSYRRHSQSSGYGID